MLVSTLLVPRVRNPTKAKKGNSIAHIIGGPGGWACFWFSWIQATQLIRQRASSGIDFRSSDSQGNALSITWCYLYATSINSSRIKNKMKQEGHVFSLGSLIIYSDFTSQDLHCSCSWRKLAKAFGCLYEGEIIAFYLLVFHFVS